MKYHSIPKLIISLAVVLTLPAAFFVSSAQTLKESVTWTNIINHPFPLPVAGTLDAVPSSLDRESVWSVGSETLDRDYAKFDNYIAYVGETGVGYARLQSGWARTEKKIGKYDFAWIEHQVDGLIEQGVHPWMCLCYGNPAYTELGYDLNAGIFPDGPVMDGWLRYVRKLARKFKGKVSMYEVWNEPDGAKPANGVKGESWREYANLFVRTAAAIREVDPDVKIAAFGAYSIGNDYFRNGLNEIDRLGGIDYIDCVTYHAYVPIPERIEPNLRRLQADCDALRPGIRILQGECGCPAQLEYGHALCNIEWTEYSQAKWDLRHMLTNFGLGIPASVFTMVDLNYGWMQQSYGLIRTNLRCEPQYKRPKFYAVQHVTSLLSGPIKADDGVRVTSCSTGLPLKVYGLEADGARIGCMLWLCGERPSDTLERTLIDVTLDGLDMRDPVLVDMLSGIVYEVGDRLSFKDGRMAARRLPAWDSPVAVIERDNVKMK